jgi:type I restriction enzyme R subunit
LLGNKDDRKELDTQFKKAESNFKIAIVVDMWLTGFDVPFLDTIYIDKPVQRHNLIQTISRVNRKFEGKKKGLVVDYIGIKKQMNLALAHYSKGRPAATSKRSSSPSSWCVTISTCWARFSTSSMPGRISAGDPPLVEQLNPEHGRGVRPGHRQDRKRVMFLVKRLKAAYDICSGSARHSRRPSATTSTSTWLCAPSCSS